MLSNEEWQEWRNSEATKAFKKILCDNLECILMDVIKVTTLEELAEERGRVRALKEVLREIENIGKEE